jgi:hypothetical protein
MNLTALIIIIIAAATILFILVKKNLKDKKELENKLNRDYPKPPHDEGDVEIDEKIH